MHTNEVVAGTALVAAGAVILAVTGSGGEGLALALGAVAAGSGALAWLATVRRHGGTA